MVWILNSSIEESDEIDLRSSERWKDHGGFLPLTWACEAGLRFRDFEVLEMRCSVLYSRLSVCCPQMVQEWKVDGSYITCTRLMPEKTMESCIQKIGLLESVVDFSHEGSFSRHGP